MKNFKGWNFVLAGIYIAQLTCVAIDTKFCENLDVDGKMINIKIL